MGALAEPFTAAAAEAAAPTLAADAAATGLVEGTAQGAAGSAFEPLTQLPASTGTPFSATGAVAPGFTAPPPMAPGGSGIVGNALSSAGKFMSENKLWTPTMLIGGNMMSGYFQNKQRLDEIARQRQSIIDGYRSGFGQSLWKA